MAQSVHAWIVDANGNYLGELDSPNSNDTFAQFAANVAAVGDGRKAIDKTVTPAKPPDPPLSAAAQARVTAASSLAALRAQPWSSLNLAQQKQAIDLAFQLGQTVPTITATS